MIVCWIEWFLLGIGPINYERPLKWIFPKDGFCFFFCRGPVNSCQCIINLSKNCQKWFARRGWGTPPTPLLGGHTTGGPWGLLCGGPPLMGAHYAGVRYLGAHYDSLQDLGQELLPNSFIFKVHRNDKIDSLSYVKFCQEFNFEDKNAQAIFV